VSQRRPVSIVYSSGAYDPTSVMTFALLSATRLSPVKGPRALRPRLTTGLPFRGQLLLLLYGNPTIVLSVGSVVLVRVPRPPSRVSLPLTLSRELSASLLSCPYRVSAPLPVTVSAPPVSSG
jgi:hypothetical protein